MGGGCSKRSVLENEKELSQRNMKTPQNMMENTSDMQIVVTEIPKLEKGYKSIVNSFKTVKKNSKSESGLGGFENLGKSDYINVVLQALNNTGPLADYFMDDVYKAEINCNTPSANLILCLGEVIRTQWMNNYDLIVPKHFVDFVWGNSLFSRNENHDSFDFLTYLFDKMNASLTRYGKSPSVVIPDDIGDGDEQLAAQAWQEHLKNNSSIIVDLFSGQIKVSYTCSECRSESFKFEVFSSLSLKMPKGNSTLQFLIKEYTKNEHIELNWFCTTCKTQVSVSKKFSLWKLPPILIFHFRRFQIDRNKLTNRIDCPIKDLDFSDILPSPQKIKPKFDLYATINHDGDLNEGHYYAIAKNKLDQKWYKFDDEIVDEISENQVLNGKSYILWYYNSSANEFNRQSKSMPYLWPHVIQSAGNVSHQRLNSVDHMSLLTPPSLSFNSTNGLLNSSLSSKDSLFTKLI